MPTSSSSLSSNSGPPIPPVSRTCYPDHRLPRVAHQTDLSADLEHLALGDPSGADGHKKTTIRRVPVPRNDSSPTLAAQRKPSDPSQANEWSHIHPARRPTPPQLDVDSKGAAIGTQNASRTNGNDVGVVPAPLNVRKRSGDSVTDSKTSDVPRSHQAHALTHKADVFDLRNSVEAERERDAVSPGAKRGGARQSEEQGRFKVKRSRLEQALPDPPPAYAREVEDAEWPRGKTDSGVGGDVEYLIKDSPTPVDVSTVLNTGFSTDTTVHERVAPAVVHETITEHHHEIIEEQITREIHNHHIYHRILPIMDFEVLPARHFITLEGPQAGQARLHEIPSSALPADFVQKTQRAIEDAVERMKPASLSDHQLRQPRTFSARSMFRAREMMEREHDTESLERDILKLRV